MLGAATDIGPTTKSLVFSQISIVSRKPCEISQVFDRIAPADELRPIDGPVQVGHPLQSPDLRILDFAAANDVARVGSGLHCSSRNPKASEIGVAAARALLPVLVALGIEIAMAAAPQGNSVERGHNFVQQTCAICHAVERVGASPNPQAPPSGELHTRYPAENLQEAFAGIVVGHPAMPMSTLDPQAIGDLIAYLKSLER